MKRTFTTLCAAALAVAAQTSMAAAPWDPVSAGFYAPDANSATILRYFENWRSIMTAPNCEAAAIDRKHVSTHAVQGMALGDLCLLPLDVRKLVTGAIDKAMSADHKRMQEAFAKAKAEGRLKAWEDELNQKHLKMLKQGGGVGWVSEDFSLNGDERLSAEVSTFVPATRRAYVTWIRKSSCAASKDDTLEPDSTYYKQLEKEYGKPVRTISESQFRAQQYEQRIADAVKLADKNEAVAKTDEDRAAVRLLRDEIRLLEKIKDTDAARNAGPGNPAIAHQWDLQGYVVSINRAGECEGQRPRHVVRLSIHGAKQTLFADLNQASRDLVRKASGLEAVRK